MITFFECVNEINSACNGLDKKPFRQTSVINSMYHIAKFLTNLGFPCVVTFSGLRGVRIMQQIVPFRQSTVDIHFSANMVVITTENVARLCLKEPSISPVRWLNRSVEIDGREISAVKTQGTCLHLCSNLSHGTKSPWQPIACVIVLEDVTFNFLAEQLHASLILSSHYLFCSCVADDGVALLLAVLGQGTLLSQGLSPPWVKNVYQQSV